MDVLFTSAVLPRIGVFLRVHVNEQVSTNYSEARDIVDFGSHFISSLAAVDPSEYVVNRYPELKKKKKRHVAKLDQWSVELQFRQRRVGKKKDSPAKIPNFILGDNLSGRYRSLLVRQTIGLHYYAPYSFLDARFPDNFSVLTGFKKR